MKAVELHNIVALAILIAGTVLFFTGLYYDRVAGTSMGAVLMGYGLGAYHRP